MPLKTIETSETKYLQVLSESGNADASLMPPLQDGEIKKIFETMLLARTFNMRALSLQREGRIGTYASIYGQEAAQIGSSLALLDGDWIFPSFRETGVLISRGFPMWMLLRYWMGDERGMKCPEGKFIFPMSVPVGTHIPHAAGAALAMKLKGADSAAIAYFGDGGSSRGDFHEALNMAGVFKAPAVFICQNNQWAISVPRTRQTAAKTIAQRGYSYGFEGMQVDGNDVFAVYRATKDAVEKARSGKGPTLLELYTYRLDDHTTADDATRYRPKEEVEEWKKKEPLIRLRAFMERKGLWTREYEEKATKEAEAAVDNAVKEAESYPPPAPGDVVRYTNSALTPRQARELKDFGWES